MKILASDVTTALDSLGKSTSDYSAVYADAARSAVSLVGGSASLPDLVALGGSILATAASTLPGLAGAAAAGANILPVIGPFISAFTAAWAWKQAERAQREQEYIAWCAKDPWVRTGKYPVDIVEGWLGDVLDAFSEPDYVVEERRKFGAVTNPAHFDPKDLVPHRQKNIEYWARARLGENPRMLTPAQRSGLAVMRKAILADSYAGGAFLFPIYLDACLQARKQIGYNVWRALAIRHDKDSPRADERPWALEYAKGVGTLYMSDWSAEAEHFPPCDYVSGGRIEKAMSFLDMWEEKVHPRFPAAQEALAHETEALRLSLASAFRAVRQRPEIVRHFKVRVS